ncbi:hypothetical protein AC1031_005564 [Aphanomyces cochlioides]|nr:hypothetical protein AC1031_005564 [Aphanomyces cochlioides]
MDATAALAWIEAQTTHPRRPEDASLCAYLRDGRVLCMLANALSGSTEVRVRSPDRFRTYHALESVSLFLRWARDRVKIPDTAMFSSAQLIDEQDEAAVLACINALAVQFGAKKSSATTTPIVPEPTKLSPLKSNTTTSSSSDVVADSASKPDSPPAKTLSPKKQWPPVASTPKPTEEPQPKVETSTPVQSQTPPAKQPKETSKPDSPSAAKTPSPKKQWPPVASTPKTTEVPQRKIEGNPVKPQTPPSAVQPTDTAPVVAPTPSKSPEAYSITSDISKASPDSSPKTRSPKEPLKKSPSSSSKLPSWPPKAPESTTSSSSPAEQPLSSNATTPPAPLVKRPSKLASFLASMPSSQSKTTLPSPPREERSESEETVATPPSIATPAPANDSPPVVVEAENVAKDDNEDVAASPEPTPSTVEEIAPTLHRFHLAPSSPSSENITVTISNLDASPFAFAWSVSRVVLVHKADDTPLFSPKWKLDSINGVDVQDDCSKSSFDAWHERFQALSAPYVCVFTPQL